MCKLGPSFITKGGPISVWRSAIAQITISGPAYDEDVLPDAAKVSLAGLRAVERRIEGAHAEIAILKAKPQAYGADKRMAYLREDLGILETARGAYDRALKEALAAKG